MKSKFNLIYENILKETSKYDYSKSDKEYQNNMEIIQQKCKQLYDEYFPKFKTFEQQINNERDYKMAFNRAIERYQEKNYWQANEYLSWLRYNTYTQKQHPELNALAIQFHNKFVEIEKLSKQYGSHKLLQELQVRNNKNKQKLGQLTPYKDFYGNQIKLGDFIIICGMGRFFQIGRVINFSNKSITIQKAQAGWDTADTVSSMKADQIDGRVIIYNDIKLTDKQKQLFGMENEK